MIAQRKGTHKNAHTSCKGTSLSANYRILSKQRTGKRDDTPASIFNPKTPTIGIIQPTFDVKTSTFDVKTRLNDANTSTFDVKTSTFDVKTRLNDANTSTFDVKSRVFNRICTLRAYQFGMCGGA